MSASQKAPAAEEERADADGKGSRAKATSLMTLVDRDGTVIESPDDDEISKRLKAKTFFWLDLRAPSADDLERLGELFGFHPLALEDSEQFGQRPKIDPYDEFAFLVVYGAAPDIDGLVEVHCFSAEAYLVTVRHDDCPAFTSLHKRAMRQPEPVREEVMLLYHVIDGLTDSFFPALAELDERIDELQGEIFAEPHEEQLQEVFAMKHHLVLLRRVITPQRDMFAQLVGSVVELPGLDEERSRYFRDIYDHLIRLSDMVDSYRDLLTGVIDVYMSTIANRRDQIMKQLTVLATIFLPITFITGFFGQNFGYMVDDLIRSRVAFVVGTALQLATVIGILAFFKRRDWI